jgi:hypothetical protein
MNWASQGLFVRRMLRKICHPAYNNSPFTVLLGDVCFSKWVVSFARYVTGTGILTSPFFPASLKKGIKRGEEDGPRGEEDESPVTTGGRSHALGLRSVAGFGRGGTLRALPLDTIKLDNRTRLRGG